MRPSWPRRSAVAFVTHQLDGAGAAARPPTPTPTAEAAQGQARRSGRSAQISGAKARRMPVPILMYHVINKAPAGVPNAELWVDKDVFADEMRALHAAGYTGGHDASRRGTAGSTAGRCRASRS